MPWRLLAVCAVAGVTAGVVLGFDRGVQYMPTLPFALVEGGILVGVPAAIFGLLLVALWSLGSFVRRRL